MQMTPVSRLIENRVDRDGGLACLPVADDQLALAAPDRHHRIDGLQARLQRLLHAPAGRRRQARPLDRQELLADDGALAVDRLAECVHHAAKNIVADGHRDDPPRPLHEIAFLDLPEFAEEDRADAFVLEVQRDAHHTMRKLQHLARHGVLDAVHARDAVADRDDASNLRHVHVDGETADLFADNLGYLVRFNVHRSILVETERLKARAPIASLANLPGLCLTRGH